MKIKKTLNAFPVSRGFAMGNTLCLDFKPDLSNASIEPHMVHLEIERLEIAINETIEDIDQIVSELKDNTQESGILSTHKEILKDPEMQQNIKNILHSEFVTLEHALYINLESIKKLFSQMEDDFIAARIIDYQDVTNRLMKKITKSTFCDEIWENKILVAEHITPTQVLEAFKKHAAGMISLNGSRKSHTAILARSFMIPYLINVDSTVENICAQYVIIDAFQGKIVLNPSAQLKDQYNQKIKDYQNKQKKLAELKNIPAQTCDGKAIGLMCNIEIPEEVDALMELNIDGIGLFRTEFLYLDRESLPDEEEQFNIYKQVAQKLAPRPVVIRTIDLGGDKVTQSIYKKEDNPNLGLRGIRLCLDQDDLFHTQLRAILRAAVYGNIKIMFPMVSSVKEIIKAKGFIEIAQQSLRDEDRKFAENIDIGTMIEVPSAALNADEIAANCDFFSIGTNDLVQYTLAVDRNNDLVADYYCEDDPAIIFLIDRVCKAAHKHNIKVSVCGEMASQTKFTALLIGLGVDELSTSPADYGLIKDKIINLDTSQCKEIANSALK